MLIIILIWKINIIIYSKGTILSMKLFVITSAQLLRFNLKVFRRTLLPVLCQSDHWRAVNMIALIVAKCGYHKFRILQFGLLYGEFT